MASMNHRGIIQKINEPDEEEGQNVKPCVKQDIRSPHECIICLDNTIDNMHHFSHFSCACVCNYHVHSSCLRSWVNKPKPHLNNVVTCLICDAPISSIIYQDYDPTLTPDSSTIIDSEQTPLVYYMPRRRAEMPNRRIRFPHRENSYYTSDQNFSSICLLLICLLCMVTLFFLLAHQV